MRRCQRAGALGRGPQHRRGGAATPFPAAAAAATAAATAAGRDVSRQRHARRGAARRCWVEDARGASGRRRRVAVPVIPSIKRVLLRSEQGEVQRPARRAEDLKAACDAQRPRPRRILLDRIAVGVLLCACQCGHRGGAARGFGVLERGSILAVSRAGPRARLQHRRERAKGVQIMSVQLSAQAH